MKVSPGRKTCCMQKKKGGYWLHTMHYTKTPVFFWRRQKQKNQLSASERFQLGKYIRIITKSIYKVTELMTDFSMQDSKSTSKQLFYPNNFLFFFGFKIVCQLLARHLSKEMETIKNYSDRLKLFFAQIRPAFTCTFLALVFSVNKWNSILVKTLAASNKEGWVLVKYPALLKYNIFLGVDKSKKFN